MTKRYRGLCPPFIAIGLVLLFAVISLVAGVTGALPVAHAATNGEDDLPPPGGTWPSTAQGTGSSTTTEGDTTVTVPEHTEPPAQGTEQEGATGTEPSTDPIVRPSDPGAESPTMEPSEPAVREDPVGRYPTRIDTNGIKIVSPTIDQLTAPGADIEALLYPSGLQLPTKYMDLLMCAPTNSSAAVTGETVNFLKTIAPTATGEYTYAEYEAADMFLAICRLYLQEAGETQTGDALKNLDQNTTVNWTNNITDARVSDYTRLVSLLTNYKSILESFGQGNSIGTHNQYRDLVAEHRDVYYSMGNLTSFRDLADGAAPNDASLSVYTNNLYSTWSYLGVTHTLTANVMSYSRFYNEFAYNGINYNKGAPMASFTPNDPNAQATPNVPSTIGGEVPGGGETQVTTPEHGQPGGDVVSGGTGPQWDNPNSQTTNDTPVQNVGSNTGADASVLPDGRKNIQDIASICALVFVVVGIVVVWGVHTYRKGHDPLSGWK